MRIKRKSAAKPAGRVITAGTNIASAAKRTNRKAQPITAATKAMRSLSPELQRFTKQMQRNMRQNASVMAATNTSNVAARPDFIEMLPLFTQQLLVTEVFGTVAMKSRQQVVPYLKVRVENDKGRSKAGDVISSPFSNRLGQDPDFTGRVVRDENVTAFGGQSVLNYNPVLPFSVALRLASGEVLVDDGNGKLNDNITIDYGKGVIKGEVPEGSTVSYQYDNETIGPRDDDQYGALMGKIDLQVDYINLIAKAHQLASYQSIYAQFALNEEYGVDSSEKAKEAAFAEMTAEINTQAFQMVRNVAKQNPAFIWDASPVFNGAVVASDYLNTFNLKLEEAAASIYQATGLARPNKIIAGTTVGAVATMINGFQPESVENTVGPYKAGKIGRFDVYVDTNYDPNEWVMLCKSEEMGRNSALYGEYMPFMQTDPITTADMTVQTGFASMYDLQVVNPATVVSGKILGAF